MDILPTCMSVHHEEDIGGLQIFGKESQRWLWAYIWVLGIKPRSPGRAHCANCWTISSADILNSMNIFGGYTNKTRSIVNWVSLSLVSEDRVLLYVFAVMCTLHQISCLSLLKLGLQAYTMILGSAIHFLKGTDKFSNTILFTVNSLFLSCHEAYLTSTGRALLPSWLCLDILNSC